VLVSSWFVMTLECQSPARDDLHMTLRDDLLVTLKDDLLTTLRDDLLMTLRDNLMILYQLMTMKIMLKMNSSNSNKPSLLHCCKTWSPSQLVLHTVHILVDIFVVIVIVVDIVMYDAGKRSTVGSRPFLVAGPKTGNALLRM